MLVELRGRQAAGEVEALAEVASHLAQLGDLRRALDALGDRVRAEPAAEVDDPARDRRGPRIGPHRVDQALVDLDHVKRAVEQAEKEIARLEAKRTEIAARLNDPALYDGPSEAITTAQKDKAWIDRDLASAEERWIEANDAYEKAQSLE